MMVWSLTHSQTSWKQGQEGLGKHHYEKANGGDGIPVELFKILKDDTVKGLHSICQQIWKTQQWPQSRKRSVFIPVSKKGNGKECSNYCTIALISHASKVMLKISKPGFSIMWAMNFQMFKLVSEKAEEPEIKLPTSIRSSKSNRVPEKHLLLLYWLCQSLWLCGSQQTGKFFKRWEYQTTLPGSWETCMQVKKQQLELDMEKQTGSKSGKEYVKAVYCHPAYLTYMENTSYKMPGWMKHKLELRLPREI